MRNRAVLLMTLAVLFAAVPLASLAPSASALDLPPPRFYTSLAVTEVGANPRFTPQNAEGETVIVVPQVPIILNITLVFDSAFDHTFTIRSTDAVAPSPQLINVDLPLAMGRGSSTSVEFTIVEAGRILFEGRNETVQVEGGRIRFFCLPHESAGMFGHIAVGGASVPAETPEMGVFLRAYWIGLLGIAATLLLTVISYFVIKGSSGHYRDHHEHIRRGGP